VRRTTRNGGTRWLTGGFSAGISVLLHLLVIGAAVSGWSGHRFHRPPQLGVGATAVASDTEPAMTLLLLDESGIGARKDEPQEEQVASRGSTTNPYMKVASLDPTPGSTQKDTSDHKDQSAADESASDQLGAARLFGLYMGQIQARIERAWLKPRTALSSAAFDCHVQISQSKQGEVLEVTLRECNGDTKWQISLVNAIERASPLPAPPDPAVFTDALRLSFRSEGFIPGENEEGFEPPERTVALAAVPLNTTSLPLDTASSQEGGISEQSNP